MTGTEWAFHPVPVVIYSQLLLQIICKGWYGRPIPDVFITDYVNDRDLVDRGAWATRYVQWNLGL